MPEIYSPEYAPSRKPRIKRTLIVSVILVIAAYGMSRAILSGHSINITNPLAQLFHIGPTPTPDPNYIMPAKEDNRLDILILGIRGEDDPNASDGGPLLTDSIQFFSYDKTTHKSSLISIPRDLFVAIDNGKKDKLNAAYEYGYYHNSDSLRFVEDEISRITGVYADKVIVFDFSSFKQIIDALGGIDITLDKSFSETQQWGFSFSLPAGPNHLDGQTALYYARSRYSSSDFDRSRRQQQIMLAIKNKLLSLNFFSDPVKTFSVLNLIRNDIKTDIGIWDIKEFIDLSRQVNFNAINRYVISVDNLVSESKGPDNSYILVPKSGDLLQIKKLFQDSLK